VQGIAGVVQAEAQDSMDAGGDMIDDAGGGQSLMVRPTPIVHISYRPN
jgi:hypothetical protein